MSSFADTLKEHYIPRGYIQVGPGQTIEYTPGEDPVALLREAYAQDQITIEQLEETLEWWLKKHEF